MKAKEQSFIQLLKGRFSRRRRRHHHHHDNYNEPLLLQSSDDDDSSSSSIDNRQPLGRQEGGRNNKTETSTSTTNPVAILSKLTDARTTTTKTFSAECAVATQQQQQQQQQQHPKSVQVDSILLYDPNAMLELSSSLCQGYVTLLSAGCNMSEQPQPVTTDTTTATSQKQQYDNMELAYSSISDGNVIDVCFGMISFTSKPNVTTTQRIKDTKEMLEYLTNSDDNDEILLVQEMVVRAYCTTFSCIIQTNKRLQELNGITRCFFSQRIRTQTVQAMVTNFDPVRQKMRHFAVRHDS